MKRTISTALLFTMLSGVLPAGAAPPRQVTIPTAPAVQTPAPLAQPSAPAYAATPADPRRFPRHRAPLARPALPALAHVLHRPALRAAKREARPGVKLPGPVASGALAEPAKTSKNSGAAVVRFMARTKGAAPVGGPAVTPGGARPSLRAGASAVRKTSTVDTSQLNVTGINRWWSYEEGDIPGVGRWMVNAHWQNLVIQSDDMDVPHRGIDLAFRRTYNSFSNHDFAGDDGSTEVGQFGNGWTNTFDAHVSTTTCPNSGYAFAGFYGFAVYDVDGARYDYCFNAAGQLVPPAGMQGTSLTVDPDGGTLYWAKKNQTVYRFYGPYYSGTSAAYSGRLLSIAARNRNSFLQFAYAWDGDASTSAHLTQMYVNTDDGMQATLAFADFNGQRLASQLTRPDGSVVTYGYDGSGNLVSVGKPAPNDGGQPVYQGYGGYRDFLWVDSPRWSATYNAASNSATDGGYVAFHMAGQGNSQTSGVQWVGVMNVAPPDGTNGSFLQSGIPTTPYQYRYETITGTPAYTEFSDTDGHDAVQYIDSAGGPWSDPGRPTVRQEYTGSAWLQTTETWDANNDVISTTNARGQQTDYAYDANGNTIATAAPQQTTSEGTFRPTRLYDYDGFSNVTAYCDERETHRSGGDWTSAPAPSDSLCSSRSGPRHVFHFDATPDQPSGELTSMVTPMGYTRRFAYDPALQNGKDYGLPTSVTGDPVSQADGTTITPRQTFAYGSSGFLRCYNKGNGVWNLRYDAMRRLTLISDPDDSSNAAPAVCNKSGSKPGWNTTTTFTYFPDGSKKSEQSPSERAYGVSSTYTYDNDGNVITANTYHGCVPNQTCSAGTTTKWYDGADRLVDVAQPHDPRTFPAAPAGGGATWPAAPYDGAPWVTRYLYDLTGGLTGSPAGGSVSMTGSASFHGYGNLYKTQSWAEAGWEDLRGSEFDASDREISKFAYQVELNGGTRHLTRATMQYDTGDNPAPGLLTKKTNPSAESIAYGYDPAGRVLSKSYSGDSGRTPNESYLYDPTGRVASITSSVFGSQQNTYDDDGRLTRTVEPSGGGVTSPAQLDYGYYADGARSGMSVTSSGVTQASAITYSYRTDGALQTQSLNAMGASATWNKSYTAAGRMLSVSGANTQSRSYDAGGQISAYATPSGSVSLTHDPEGSVLSEALPNVWFLGAPGTTNEQTNYTYNVRGERIQTYVGDSTGPYVTQQYSTDSGFLNARSLPDDSGTVPEPNADYLNGVLLGNGSWSSVNYNGQSYPVGSSNSFVFDATGRLSTQVKRTGSFSPSGSPPTKQGGASPGTALSIRDTTTYTYDAENHTAGYSIARVRTQTLVDQNVTTTSTSSPGTATIGWGPNEHPILAGGKTYHWDGDTVLFVTDSSGNVTDFKVGLDGDITTRDLTYNGLTVYDRDVAGVIVRYTNSTGTSGYQPSDSSTTSAMGSPSNPNFKMPMSVDAQYLRPDGFYIGPVQINGVRAFHPDLGTWTTPDAYEGDVHDPASQQRYMWNRGNPVDYQDPSGYCIPACALAPIAVGAGMELLGDAVILAGGAAAGAMIKEHGRQIITATQNAIDATLKAVGHALSENSNPYAGPVDKPVTAVDRQGNAIPVQEGESIGSSPDGEHQQVKDANGKPTGVRLDGKGHPGQKDPKAKVPHAHRPGVSSPDGNPHLPINH